MTKIHRSPEYIKHKNKKIISDNGGIIGCELYSRNCGKFKVIDVVDTRENGEYIYSIVFLNTNGKRTASKGNIVSGKVVDYNKKTIYGVASLGERAPEIKSKDPKLYDSMLYRYRSLIYRIYDTKRDNYERYGGKGITISEDLLEYDNFFDAIVNNSEFDREKFISGELEIDKDKKQLNIPPEKRIYAENTISLLNHEENGKYKDYDSMKNKLSKSFITIDHDGHKEIHKNIHQFSIDNNIDERCIHSCLNGKRKHAGGYEYRYLDDEDL